MIGEHYLTTQSWQKSFNPRNHEVKSTCVWVQFPDLPIEFSHPEAVLRIAKRVGTPIHLDRATELGARGGFTRVCVEVDLTKPLLSHFKIEGIEYDIRYEGLDNICFECGTYGHQTLRCPTLHQEEDPLPSQETPLSSQAGHAEPYGEWMVARRRDKRQGVLYRARKTTNPMANKPKVALKSQALVLVCW
ncbi:unnamed protein product [Linum tenue]|nr:unnamed protein product [Linum tenue]